MNAAQIHLALNHVPLFLSIIGGGILVLGMIKKNESFKTLSLFMLIAAAMFTAPVFLTGEGTEELVENLAGVNEKIIEKHEDMAKISLVIIIITGVIALLGLILRRNKAITKITFVVAALLSLASFGTMAQTAHLGGLIRHSEMQNGSTNKNEENENTEGEEEQTESSNNRSLQKKLSEDSLKIQEKQEKKDVED
jgi:uncharacterized membrane protein